MRLTALDLRDYGPFRNAPVLDLAGGDRGLHVIVGPNEAGKSTALRAIRALLFDFPNSVPDAHGHDLGGLRVGGTLRDEAGAELAFLRRKRGQRLWTPDDRAALPPDALAPFLGRLDEATFVDLFSTDHAELVAGGQLIIRGGGRLGEMLFSAGTGLAQLDRVRDALQKEMDALFKTRNATVPAINKALIDLKAAHEVVKRDALPTADWVDAHNRLHRADADRARVARRRHEAQAELDRLKGWLGALRVVPRRRDVLDRIAGRGAVAPLRPGFAEAYRAEAEAARAADRAAHEAGAALAQAEGELARLGPPDPALREADAVNRLHADLGRYVEARRDRPARGRQLARVEEQAASIRAEIPPAASVPAGGLGPVRDPIQALAREHAGLLVRRSDAEAELARAGRPDAEGDDEAIPAAQLRWAGALQEVIARVTGAGDLEARRLQARGALLAAEAEAATALRGLALWAGTLDDLEALAIPPDASFDHADAAIRLAEDRARAAAADLGRLEGERIDLDRAGELARVAGAIPTASDLAAARDRRDALWRSIRRGWVDREPLAPSPARLADEFEAESRRADAAADDLRHAADRVAAEAQRAVDRRALLDRIVLAEQARASALAEREHAFEGWAGHWRPLGIEPLTPREMKDWVRVDRQARLRCAGKVREARAEVARIAARVDELRAEIGHALARVGEPGPGDGESLVALLARGHAVVARVDAQARRDAARGRLAEVHALEAAWLDRWAEAVAPLGLPPAASVGTATTMLDRLGAWLDATREARTLRATLDDLDATERRFAAEARALAGRLGIALPEPADDWQPVAEALVDRLAQAGEARTRRASWQARLDEEQGRLARNQAALARAGAMLAALAAEAGVGTPAELPAAIARAGEAEADRLDLRRLDEQLEACAGVLTRDELLAAIADLDEAGLAGRIAASGEALADLEAEAHRLGEEIGAARERLDAMDQGPGAAGAQQLVEEQAARLGAEVERFARLKLASAILRDAVERHRAKHQGPVLDRAGALFRRLTAGSFAGVRVDLDDKNEPILRGVRGLEAPEGDDPAPVGPLVDVAEMSAGTADQLYLALRLASLSVHLDDPAHEPSPLVADDILVHFDDRRALAALEALVDLSRRTQVLLFTHHDHLAEMAATCLPAGAVFVHRLVPVGEPPAPSSPLAGPKPRRKRGAAASVGDLG